MRAVSPRRIKDVKISYLNTARDKKYADSAEDTLFDLFANNSVKEAEQKRKKILGSNPPWAVYYHLSPFRRNLFRMYEFRKGTTVLEVGAGCGAITEELVKKDIDVCALELSEKRSLINAYRNQQADNLEIIVGNLDVYKPKNKFDYVVCVGVLEYAGTFYHSHSPYRDFLTSLRNKLRPEGTLLLAIENRFGLKYWAGAMEDHTKTYFEGHNGYPNSSGIQTFGRLELRKLLNDSGFANTRFYYPFPDYKNPSVIYSDDYYPGKNTTFPLGRLPTPTLDRARNHFFSEQNVMRYLERNDLFPNFSNSFFVEASL